MANILNLLSEETFAEKMEAQNVMLAAIARGVGSDAVPEVNSWGVVQKLVRLGIASKVFNIGDQLVCNHTKYGKLTWDIIGIDQDTPVNTEYTHSMTLLLHDCLPAKAFDAAEPTNTDANRAGNGSACWSTSNIRQWLNSDGEAGKWWTAQTEYDAAPDYSSEDGFIKGLDADFVAAVGEASKITILHELDGGGSITTNDKFFLPSCLELYCGADYAVEDGHELILEGSVYAYYSEKSDNTAATYAADSNRIKYINGAATNWMTRSPYVLSTRTSHYRMIDSNGTLSARHGRAACAFAPACCII